MTAALGVPPRIVLDIKENDARNLKLFLQNIKERLDGLTATTGSITTTINVVAGSAVSQEEVEDIVGGIFADSASIDFTYDDPSDTVTAVITSAYTTARDDFAVAMAIALG